MSGIHILHRNDHMRKAASEPLSQNGFEVRTSNSMAGGVAAVLSDTPELVLLEWLGADPVLQFLRTVNGHVDGGEMRIIVVTDQGAREDAAQAWDFGIEDCLIHPFGAAELLGRVRAALGRRAGRMSRQVVAGPLVMDRASHHVRVNGQLLNLAPTEFRLLRFLLENPSRVFSRQELLDRAWGDNVKVGPRTVDVHVRRLRQLLEPFGCDGVIQTVRGFGYRLSAQSRVLGDQVPRTANGVELSSN